MTDCIARDYRHLSLLESVVDMFATAKLGAEEKTVEDWITAAGGWVRDLKSAYEFVMKYLWVLCAKFVVNNIVIICLEPFKGQF